MMEIPQFSLESVVFAPWREDPEGIGWIALMGFFVILGCGLVGKFLILRRMALMGDAVSHSVLPGIVLAYLWMGRHNPLALALGAAVAGMLTTALVEGIRVHSRIKVDAALGIVFTTLFAIGVILITLFADMVDLDADCVLHGEIGFLPLYPPVEFRGIVLGPWPLLQMGVVAAFVVGLIWIFYKELLATAFDPILARSLGMRPRRVHFLLMLGLSLVIVSAFEAVGAILVVAMLIFPGATGALWSDRLPVILWLVAVCAAFSSLIGLHLAFWWDASIAGCMVVAAMLLFGFSWVCSPRRGLLRKVFRRKPTADMAQVEAGG